MDEYLKYFLHALLRHRLLTLTDGVTMFALINDAFGRERVDDPEQVLQLISTMNSALRPFGFEIMRPFDHETGEAFLALVNVQNDDISLLATEFSSLQMEFLKKLLEFMVTKTKGTFVVDITTALNLVADKKKEMEVFLGNLVRAKWLLRDAEYFAEFIASYRALFTVGFRMTEIRCSPRLLCELRGYLRMEYPQYIFDCAICKDLVTIGWFCDQSEACDAKYHKRCADRYFISRAGTTEVATSSRPCLKCGLEWKPTIFKNFKLVSSDSENDSS